jgi:hypothetical protein
VCIFTEKGSPHAVIFEVGFICGHLGIEKTLPRLKFCIHHKIERIEVIPRYFDYLLAKAEYCQFYDEARGRTLYDRILEMIQSEVVRQYCPPDTT